MKKSKKSHLNILCMQKYSKKKPTSKPGKVHSVKSHFTLKIKKKKRISDCQTRKMFLMDSKKTNNPRMSLSTKSLNIIQFSKDPKMREAINTNHRKTNNKKRIKIIITTGRLKTIHCSGLLWSLTSMNRKSRKSMESDRVYTPEWYFYIIIKTIKLPKTCDI